MIAPRPLASGAPRLPPRHSRLRLAIDSAQIAQILRRASELRHHAHQRVLELRWPRRTASIRASGPAARCNPCRPIWPLPAAAPASSNTAPSEASTAGASARAMLMVLPLRARIILQILLGEAVEQALHFARQRRAARPRRHTRRNRRRPSRSPSPCARTPAWSRSLPARPRRTACTAPRAGCVPRWSGRGACECRSCRRRRAGRPRCAALRARAASVLVDAGPAPSSLSAA